MSISNVMSTLEADVYSNLWTPYRQRETVRLLAEHYKFSARLSAILRTPPPPSPAETSTPENGAPRLSFHHDTEKANGRVSIQLKDVQTPAAEANHYTIASHLTNYQSVDVGEKCMRNFKIWRTTNRC